MGADPRTVEENKLTQRWKIWDDKGENWLENAIEGWSEISGGQRNWPLLQRSKEQKEMKKKQLKNDRMGKMQNGKRKEKKSVIENSRVSTNSQ